MEDNQLKIVIEVAQCGSFSKAETVCHISKQAISKQIDALEKELGFSLFSRSFHGVSLTEQGKIFTDGAKRLLDLKQEILEQCRQAAPRKNQLRISSVEYHTLLSGIDERFRQEYPEIKLIPIIHTNHSVLYRLRHDMVDLGEVSVNFKDECGDSILYQKLISLPYMCIMQPDHLLAYKEKINLSDLAKRKVQVYKNSIHPKLLEQLEKTCRDLRVMESLNGVLSAIYEALHDGTIVILANKFIYRLPNVHLAVLNTKYDQEFGIVYKDKENELVRNYLALAKKWVAEDNK